MSHYFVAIMKYLNHLIATKCLLMHFALNENKVVLRNYYCCQHGYSL